MITLIILIAFIWGTVDYFRLPKPPKGLSNRELKYYYTGGWKEYLRMGLVEPKTTRQRELYGSDL